MTRLATLGPVVLVPTHVSNLDAFILGWVLHELELPPFSYGAGLNLYGGPLRRFCMGHLGAYPVDRNKTDPVYRTTLKAYASALLEHGLHMLFFPGGTRSRSGALETRLKLGLLGTGLEAMRRRLPADPSPIFFVPCTLSYPLVLEAETLVREYLRNQGGFRYMEPPDEFERLPRWFDLLRALARLRMRIHVRVGRPLDPFGNPVDEDGISRDPSGRAIDPAGYLREGNRVVDDPARDAEYTRILAAKLRQAYRSDVVALPTHAVAWAAYSLMRAAHPELDLFRFLHRTQTGISFGIQELTARLAQVLDALERAERKGSLSCSATLKRAKPDEVLHVGLDAFSAYHQRCALMLEGGRAHVRASELVYYYQNRIAEHVVGVGDDPVRTHGSAP
jgi:glycerol-3-phosphate O-acyltransferase